MVLLKGQGDIAYTGAACTGSTGMYTNGLYSFGPSYYGGSSRSFSVSSPFVGDDCADPNTVLHLSFWARCDDGWSLSKHNLLWVVMFGV
jgi:hypothetical protein